MCFMTSLVAAVKRKLCWGGGAGCFQGTSATFCPSSTFLRVPLLPSVSAVRAGGKPAPRAGQPAEPRGQRSSEGQPGEHAEGPAGDPAGSKLEGKGLTSSPRPPSQGHLPLLADPEQREKRGCLGSLQGPRPRRLCVLPTAG